MASFSVTSSGKLSDVTIYAGPPTAAPATSGDTITLGAFIVEADYTISIASLVTNGGTIIPGTGNITVTAIALTSLGTLGLLIKGSYRNHEYLNSTSGYASQGVGGIG